MNKKNYISWAQNVDTLTKVTGTGAMKKLAVLNRSQKILKKLQVKIEDLERKYLQVNGMPGSLEGI